MYDRLVLLEFAIKINNISGIQEQGRALLSFMLKAACRKQASMLFLDRDNGDYTVLTCMPKSKSNPFNALRFSRQNPLIRYLTQKKKPLTSESLITLPDFRRFQNQEEYSTKRGKIDLIIPILNCNRLIGILVFGEKSNGNCEPEEISILQEIADLTAISLEKEYLIEQLNRQKKELTVINRSSAIMASSLDVQRIFDRFIEEVRKIADIDWAAINLVGDNDLFLLALFSDNNSIWKAGDRLPANHTATEWVVKHKKTIVEPDISHVSRFATAEIYPRQGIHSVAYLPLILESKAIGSLIITSRKPNAYNQRQITLLEGLTAQIIKPIEHSQLYTELEAKSRVDGLTGLFNRRSFDEEMENEISRHTRYGGIFSLIVIDVDSLKTINDTYGHLFGDEALRQVGEVIRKVIRTSDRAFRYGGDEFAILLPNSGKDAAEIVTERIRNLVALSIWASHAQMTVSLGLASWPANGKDANAVISAADAALYYAKRNGGNQVHKAPTI